MSSPIGNAINSLCARTLDLYAQSPLFTRNGEGVTLRDGYVPLLVDYTVEDKEARGLRVAREDANEARRPIYFSALEQAASEPLLLLTGERGAGKTAFALDLALSLAGERIGSDDFNLRRLDRVVPRNDFGHAGKEAWPLPGIVPLYLRAGGESSLAALVEKHSSYLWESARAGESLLLIVDEADRLGPSGPALLEEAIAWAARFDTRRILIAGTREVCENWIVPTAFSKRRLLPLLQTQRRDFVARWLSRDAASEGNRYGNLLGNPSLLALSLELGGESNDLSAPALVDCWLSKVTSNIGAADRSVEAAYRAYAGTGSFEGFDLALPVSLSATLNKTFIQQFLAARYLEKQAATVPAALFHADPDKWGQPIKILAQRRASHDDEIDLLVHHLIAIEGDAGLRGALLAAEISAAMDRDTPSQAAIEVALLTIVDEGRLSIKLREQAGRKLAELGDPRELEALVSIPRGRFTMGSTMTSNSSPPHEVEVLSFKLGRYPVTNRLYGCFIDAEQRLWNSKDRGRPDRANAPAVDLTWHDARAFCVWLTREWRGSGHIAVDEIVRLPTEPEWEHAARGDQADTDAILYPWAGAWEPDRENSEEAGFNDTCAVGLFPAGRSPYGCYDMAGQVWEWTSTLWGGDMTVPSFKYPYADDGREDPTADPKIRRVLRGGCFSSGKEKACCTYRGSLEPNGFWRGNGLRVAVARVGPDRVYSK